MQFVTGWHGSFTWPSLVTNKQEDTTQNIETESVNIRLPGQVIQCSAWTVRAGPWLTSVNRSKWYEGRQFTWLWKGFSTNSEVGPNLYGCLWLAGAEPAPPRHFSPPLPSSYPSLKFRATPPPDNYQQTWVWVRCGATPPTWRHSPGGAFLVLLRTSTHSP